MGENRKLHTIAKQFGDSALVVTTSNDVKGDIRRTLAALPTDSGIDPCLLMPRVKGNIDTIHVEPLKAAMTRNPEFV